MIGLPPAAAISVARRLFEMGERHGATLLFATHDPESAVRCRLRFCLSDRGLLPVVDHGDADGGAGWPGPGASPPDAS